MVGYNRTATSREEWTCLSGPLLSGVFTPTPTREYFHERRYHSASTFQPPRIDGFDLYGRPLVIFIS